MIRGLIAALAALVLALPMAVQARAFRVGVSGYSDGQPVIGTKYAIMPQEDQRQATAFEFPEYARHVERALATKNMVRVADAANADVLVYLGYGVTDPIKHSESTPNGRFIPVPNGSMTMKMAPDGKLVSVPATTNQWVGSDSTTTEWTTFDRWLTLSAVDAAELRQNGRARERWHLEVKSSGDSNDLRLVMPYMTYSASKYVGTDTGHALPVKVKEKDKAYLQYMAAPPAP
jgi:hypothetical protein